MIAIYGNLCHFRSHDYLHTTRPLALPLGSVWGSLTCALNITCSHVLSLPLIALNFSSFKFSKFSTRCLGTVNISSFLLVVFLHYFKMVLTREYDNNGMVISSRNAPGRHVLWKQCMEASRRAIGRIN